MSEPLDLFDGHRRAEVVWSSQMFGLSVVIEPVRMNRKKALGGARALRWG